MAFDPYESWLGIPGDRRPPTYYDLLGLSPFESDPITIEQAALLRAKNIHQHQLGPHSLQSQDILSELARASLILTHPVRRAEYDGKLRASGSGVPAPSVVTETVLAGIAEPRTSAPVDAVAQMPEWNVVLQAEAGNELSIRPTKGKTGVRWKRALVAMVFMAIHAAIFGCCYVLAYDPWNWRQNGREVPRKGGPAQDPNLILKTTPDRGGGKVKPKSAQIAARKFDGRTRISIAKSDEFEMTDSDYTIFARIKTDLGGTIFSKTADGPWIPDGKSLFVRDGKLAFDIGWAGFAQSDREVADGEWHNVAMTFDHDRRWVRLFVDGACDGDKALAPKYNAQGHIVRIAYTPLGYPCPLNYFVGQISDLRFYDQILSDQEIGDLPAKEPVGSATLARWSLRASENRLAPDETGHGHDGTVEVEDRLNVGSNGGKGTADQPGVMGTKKDRFREVERSAEVIRDSLAKSKRIYHETIETIRGTEQEKSRLKRVATMPNLKSRADAVNKSRTIVPSPTLPALNLIPELLLHSEWNFIRRTDGIEQGGAFKIVDGAIYHLNSPNVVGQVEFVPPGQLHLIFQGHRQIADGEAWVWWYGQSEWRGQLDFADNRWEFAMRRR